MNHPQNQGVKLTVTAPRTTPKIKEVLDSDNKGRVVSTEGFIYIDRKGKVYKNRSQKRHGLLSEWSLLL